MKALSICSVALFISSSLVAGEPVIHLKVVGGENKTISYLRPAEGRYFPELPKEDTLNEKGELTLPNVERVAGAYLFVYHRSYRLYVEPGESYTVTIDNQNKENPVTVEGPQQEAELALLKLNWGFSQTEGVALYRQHSVFANNKQRIMNLLDSCVQPFDQLHKDHKISKPFYAYVKSLINNYYTALLASTLVQPIRSAVYNKDSAGYDATSLHRLDGEVQEAMKMINLTDPATVMTDTYLEYLYFYQYMYLGYHLPLMKGEPVVKGTDNGENIFIRMEIDLTKEPIREYTLALYLKTMLIENRFQIYIPDLYKEFVGQYPHSRYINLLAAGIDKVKDYYVQSKKELTFDQRFVSNYDSIATIEELLSHFKDKVIYIDMWATWCGPCKEQFGFKKDIDPFFKSKGVEVVYISLDRGYDKQKWVDMIKYYNLDGYHVLASEKLAGDIYKTFGKRNTLMIPRYVICKNGKVILKDAKRPQDKTALIKQIESVL
jgi:thiol-disulfide isomerase/thioredoxin